VLYFIDIKAPKPLVAKAAIGYKMAAEQNLRLPFHHLRSQM